MLGQFNKQNSTQNQKTKNQQPKSNQKAPVKVAQQTKKPSIDKQVQDKKLAPKKTKSQPNVSNSRRKELMAFFKTHHPELQRLVSQLQKSRPVQYQATLRSLDREVKSLQSLKSRSPERYKKSLQIWKVSTDIRVQTAQLARKQNPKEKNKIRGKLKSLIAKQHDLKVEQLRVDFEWQKKRMEKLQKQLSSMEEDRDNLIARKMESLNKSAQRISAQHKKAAEAKKKQPKPEKKKPKTNTHSNQEQPKKKADQQVKNEN